jgi:hypothetical protein
MGYEGLWRFDEWGDVAADASTWGRHGDVVGAVRAAGESGGLSLDFSAEGGAHVEILYDSLDLSLAGGEMTVEARAQTGDPNLRGGLVSWFSAPPNAAAYSGFRLAAVASKEFTFQVTDAVQAALVDPGVVANAWHAVVGRYELGSDGLLSLLVDWIVKQVTATTVGLTDADEGKNLWFGRDHLFHESGNEGEASWNGRIDEVRLMSRALAEDEILHYPRASWELGPTSSDGLP